jgi:hypothetical protein
MYLRIIKKGKLMESDLEIERIAIEITEKTLKYVETLINEQNYTDSEMFVILTKVSQDIMEIALLFAKRHVRKELTTDGQ